MLIIAWKSFATARTDCGMNRLRLLETEIIDLILIGVWLRKVVQVAGSLNSFENYDWTLSFGKRVIGSWKLSKKLSIWIRLYEVKETASRQLKVWWTNNIKMHCFCVFQHMHDVKLAMGSHITVIFALKH